MARPSETLFELLYRTANLGRPVLRRVVPKLGAKLDLAMSERCGNVPARVGDGPCVVICAVSVGEVNATRALAQQLTNEQDDLQVVIAASTTTGRARAAELFGTDSSARVFAAPYPVDLRRCVRSFLDSVRPAVAVLMELEVWPGFVGVCRRRGVPVLLANGRITDASFAQYRKARPLLRGTFASINRALVQEDVYGQRLVDLGVPAGVVQTVGSMKFDSASLAFDEKTAASMASDLGLSPGDGPVLVCGSTGPGEEAMLLDAYAGLRQQHQKLRLVIVPRKPERFDEVAERIAERFPLVRRSKPANAPPADAVVLIDTMGELRSAYALASVVVVGRTLVDLGEKQHGSDMIEPVALGKPAVVGPFTGNFAEPMRRLLAGGGIRQIQPGELQAAVALLLNDPAAADEMGQRGRAVVVQSRGATTATARAVAELLDADGGRSWDG